ncbi:diguanylate cyclase [Cyanobacterium aponinum AL20118]|uniref:Diguanylate cyclase n=1 Tax=Cyanobacterium aponinum AL20115 TaxID=3090662 RepID=A0AAF0ZE39_9CHRO|nr:diguanylate cyclase [Cyanobacterium aponinum]PHV63251.1 hypothetical protein CSQ80_05800 [Cyanobacterium aponinum IPPAS B-1201]WPF88580.1 diguanylate cyclase [Cyanobacterium aponinum AL20115]
MIDLNQLFSSIDPNPFVLSILAKIKHDLEVDQVFISQFNSSGELENIINGSELISKKKDSFQENSLYEISDSLIGKIKKNKQSYFTHDSDDLTEDTYPLKRAELLFPIKLKTPQVITVNEDIELWGILSIYDYNYERKWQEEQIKQIDEIISILTLAIERKIIFDKLIETQQQCQSYSLLDDQTGLANYSAFIDCLDYEWRRLAREKQPLSLILFKLRFEAEFNTRILAKIGYLIQEEIKRPADLGAYFGNNKIMIMLPNTNSSGALWVKKNIFKSLAKITNAQKSFQCVAEILTIIPEYNQDYNSIINNLEKSLPNFE